MTRMFQTDDYRVALRWHLRDATRAVGRGQTSRLARLAGVTAGQVRNIIAGRRDLAIERLEGFVRGMDLAGEEADYFSAMVRAAHAPSAAERARAAAVVLAMRQARGAPARGRPRGSGRERSQGAALAEAGALALLIRPWVRSGQPLHPFAVATLLDGVANEAQIRRALVTMPELADPVGEGDAVPQLVPRDEVGAGALARALGATRARIGGLRPPDRSLDTTHALIRVSDLPELVAALDEAWAAAVTEARALAQRATAPLAITPVHIHQLTVALWPQHTPFSTDDSVRSRCSNEQTILPPAPCAPENPALTSGAVMPTPFDYLELIPFLAAWLAARARVTPGYNMSRFSRKVGCTLSHVHAVFRGERALTERLVPDFVRALGLSGSEASYFGLLASLARVQEDGYRALLLRQMSTLVAQRNAPMPEGLAFSTLVEPPHLVLYEAAGAPGFRADPAWVAAALGWEVDAARDALDALRAAGLLTADGAGGLIRSSTDFSLPSHIAGPPVERSQRWFVDASMTELGRGVADRAGRALGMLLQVTDREALRQVAAGLHRVLEGALDALGHRVRHSPGPYAVYTLQVTASPVSRALKVRPT